MGRVVLFECGDVDVTESASCQPLRQEDVLDYAPALYSSGRPFVMRLREPECVS